MLKVATPVQLPNLGVCNTTNTTIRRLDEEDNDVKIPNIAAFYRSPYNGRIKCKKSSNHPSIIVEKKSEDMSELSSGSETNKSPSTESSEISDSNSDISCSNSSGLRGILSKQSETKKEKKPEKRVKFHEQLEDVRELLDVTCGSFRRKPHITSKRQNNSSSFNNLSPKHCNFRATASDSDLFRKQKYDIDRHVRSFSDFEELSRGSVPPGCFVSTSVSGLSDNSRSTPRTLFKSPMRHSYQQHQRHDNSSLRGSRIYQSEVNMPGVIGRRSESVLPVYSPKILQDSTGQQYVVCRFIIPKHEGSSCYGYMRNENILKLKQGLNAKLLPDHHVSPNFCNRDKASRIMRWLDSVDDVQTKEGRYAELLDNVFHSDRTG